MRRPLSSSPWARCSSPTAPRCKMTQEFVAEAIGVSRQAVSKWEQGATDPAPPTSLPWPSSTECLPRPCSGKWNRAVCPGVSLARSRIPPILGSCLFAVQHAARSLPHETPARPSGPPKGVLFLSYLPLFSLHWRPLPCLNDLLYPLLYVLPHLPQAFVWPFASLNTSGSSPFTPKGRSFFTSPSGNKKWVPCSYKWVS